MQMKCEFCDNQASHINAYFAGDHSPALGPLSLCDTCFKFMEECNGYALSEDE